MRDGGVMWREVMAFLSSLKQKGVGGGVGIISGATGLRRRLPDGPGTRRRSSCLSVCLRGVAPARRRRLIIILGLSSRDGSTLTLWLTADISLSETLPRL